MGIQKKYHLKMFLNSKSFIFSLLLIALAHTWVRENTPNTMRHLQSGMAANRNNTRSLAPENRRLGGLNRRRRQKRSKVGVVPIHVAYIRRGPKRIKMKNRRLGYYYRNYKTYHRKSSYKYKRTYKKTYKRTYKRTYHKKTHYKYNYKYKYRYD